MQCVTRNLE